MTYPARTAWDLIGWDDGKLRIPAGRLTYDAVVFNDTTHGHRVRLDRLDVGANGIRVVNRYVDPDTLLVPADDDARSNWATACR